MHNAPMTVTKPLLRAHFATSRDDIRAAQRLRYEVFVTELGAKAPDADHSAGRECDRFDDHAKHLVLRDETRGPGCQIVGVYRVLDATGAADAGGFYSQSEYDLTPLHRTSRRVLELSRSCLHPDYRHGPGLLMMWGALHQYCRTHEIDVLFGVASFRGAEAAAHVEALSYLHHTHLAPPEMRLRSTQAQTLSLLPEADIDRARAMRAVPSLIKGYLRLGGKIGQGVFIDHDFNTTDICLVLDIHTMPASAVAKLLAPGRAR